MTWVGHLAAAGACAVVAGVAAVPLPRWIAALPEPEPDPEPTAEELAAAAARRVRAEERATRRGKAYQEPVPEPPKEPYAELGARPRLAARLAVVAAVSGAVIGLALGWDWALLVWVPLLPLGAALGYIDWHTRLLPNQLVYPAYVAAVVGALVAAAAGGDVDSLVRAAVSGVLTTVFYAVLWFVYPSGLGFGDVRLSGVLGFALGYLGWGEMLVGLYAGFLLGGVIGVVLRLSRIVRQRHVPFGPFMLVGALVGIVWGRAIGTGLYGG